MQTKVFHKYAFITQRQFVSKVMQTKYVCKQPNRFLDCVLHDAEIDQLTALFAGSEATPEDLVERICADDPECMECIAWKIESMTPTGRVPFPKGDPVP
jgi:hypothetical protein